MDASRRTSQRVVIVGGGVSGLSIAARLAQAGLPVTLLEASRLGVSATTRNQGWLHSGGWFALHHPDLARMCHASLAATRRFCPDCLEPQAEGMAYVISRPDTLASDWTHAWSRAGIPFQELPVTSLFDRAEGLDRSLVQHAWLLPDCAFRPEVLLNHLAATARNAGAEIRTGTPVAKLEQEGEQVVEVVTAGGERVAARFVILAAGTASRDLLAESAPGRQPTYALIEVKTQLLALTPGAASIPFCVVDQGGFNHVPHGPTSVFGSNRWTVVTTLADRQAEEAETERIRNSVSRLFPRLNLDAQESVAWAGTTVEAMHVDQVEPAVAPRPTVIDHAQEPNRIVNLLSIYPGRATLWTHLAEDASRIALEKLEASLPPTAHPPWADTSHTT